MKISRASVDTSFLTQIANKKADFHNEAKAFLRILLERDIRIFVSTVALSEFAVKGDINVLLDLANFRFSVFTIPEAILSGELRSLVTTKEEKAKSSEDRIFIKNDIKILSQVYENNIDLFITRDEKFITSIKRLESLKEGFSVNVVNFEKQQFPIDSSSSDTDSRQSSIFDLAEELQEEE